MFDIFLLASQCAPDMSPQTLVAITKVESDHNPYAIGVVDGYLARQPRNKDEALATTKMLHRDGWNFSMGIGQINIRNLSKYNLTFETVFDPCENLRVAAKIFNECYQRALTKFPTERDALLASYSCYYSGNFTRGFRNEGNKKNSYVDKVVYAESFATDPLTINSLTIPIISKKDGTRQRGMSNNIKPVKERNNPDDEGARVYNSKSKSLTGRISELRGD